MTTAGVVIGRAKKRCEHHFSLKTRGATFRGSAGRNEPMNRIFDHERKEQNRRQARCYRRAQELIRASSIRLREARQLKPWDLPEGAADVFARDVEDLLREARRFVRRGRRMKVS